MTGSNIGLPEQRRRAGRFWLFIVGVVAIVVLLGSYYRIHLFWRYTAWHLKLQDVPSIPDVTMPESPIPKGWIRCRVGHIEFSLPPELASNRSIPKTNAAIVMFQHGSRLVVVFPTEDESEFSDLLKTASELCPHSERFTMPRLRHACYQASSNNFHWSMTPDEVRWHAFCMTTGELLRPSKSFRYTESFFRQDLDGIVQFGRDRGILFWQSKDPTWGGFIHFIEHNSAMIDTSWMRSACQSLKISNETDTEIQPPVPGEK